MIEQSSVIIEAKPRFRLVKRTQGDGGSGGADLEARVGKLETQFEKIDGKLDAVRIDLAEVKGRVSSLPTTLQLIGFIVAIFVASGLFRAFGL